jgi:hypothetical protein
VKSCGRVNKACGLLTMTDVASAGRGQVFCRGCGSKRLFLALDLGSSPIANALLTNPLVRPKTFPLELRVCEDCKLGQIGEFLTPENLFDDYPYFSSTSKSWLEKSLVFAEQISRDLGLTEEDLILEIASNDGYQLGFFKEMGMQVLGVEPATTVADVANAQGIPTRAVFFGKEAALVLNREGLKPKLIIAKNVLAHVPDLDDFVSGITLMCGRETVVVIEAPTILQISQGNQFDTVYHEHFSYLSATAVRNLFDLHGLDLFGAERLGTHGGSVRLFARAKDSDALELPGQESTLNEILEEEARSNFGRPESWLEVSERVSKTASDFKAWLASNPGDSVTVGYGAAAKAVTLLSLTEPGTGSIDIIIDNSPGKIGKYLPVGNTPIVSETEFLSTIKPGPYRFVVFPWNLAGEILPRIRAIDPQAEVVAAVPQFRSL